MKIFNLTICVLFSIFAVTAVNAQNIEDSNYTGSPTFSILNPMIDNLDTDMNDVMRIQTEGTKHEITVRLLSPLPTGHDLQLSSNGIGTKGTNAAGSMSITTSSQILFSVGGAAENFPTVTLFYTLTVPSTSPPQSYDIDLEICVEKQGGGGKVYCMNPTGSAVVGEIDEIEVFPDVSTTFEPKPDHPNASGDNVVITLNTATLDWTSSGPNKEIVIEPLATSFPWGLTVEVTNINCTSGSCGSSTGPQNAASGGSMTVVNSVNGSGTADIVYVTTVPIYESAQSNSLVLQYTIE